VDPSLLVEHLDTLIDTCQQGADGNSRCAGQAQSLALQWLLTQRSHCWHKAAAELQALREQYASTAPARAGELHAGWVPAKGMLAGFSDLALLAVCDRGEDAALQRYREFLDEDLPIVLRAVAQRHSDAVRDHRAQLRSARILLNTAQRPDAPACPENHSVGEPS
jgi:uncharacterized protein (TIGR02284 family)